MLGLGCDCHSSCMTEMIAAKVLYFIDQYCLDTFNHSYYDKKRFLFWIINDTSIFKKYLVVSELSSCGVIPCIFSIYLLRKTNNLYSFRNILNPHWIVMRFYFLSNIGFNYCWIATYILKSWTQISEALVENGMNGECTIKANTM